MESSTMFCVQPALRRALLCLAALSAVGSGHAASFDCRRPANTMERIICADRDLSQLDERLAITYKRFMSTSANPYEDQRAHQEWLAERNRCADAACARVLYGERSRQLRADSGGWLTYRTADKAWVATAAGEAVCQAARAQLEALGASDFAMRGPGQGVGTLCGAPGHDCPAARAMPLSELSRAGVQTDAPPIRELLAAEAPIAVSRVDVNNDGIADLHLAQWVGPDRCERSVALLAGASGRLEPATGDGFDALSQTHTPCGGDRLTYFRHRDTNYVVALGEQRVLLLRGAPKEGLQRVCGFKRRWTEQEKRAAYAVLKRHPGILRDARILRPEKGDAPDGRRVWTVQVRCPTGSLRASFQVDPRTLSPQVLIAPSTTAPCETQRIAGAGSEAPPLPAP
jgi:uncharacterized protein